MFKFRQLFGEKRCAVIGMIHVGALPGTPCYAGSIRNVLDAVKKEAEIYKRCSVDGVMLENMHDIPYLRSHHLGHDTTSMMTRACSIVRQVLPSSVHCGVQVLAGCNEQAIAVAQAAELQFIRAEGFVFPHLADEGFIDACAGPLLRYRKSMQADHILVFTDIKKKHSAHAVTSDVTLEETAKAAEFFLSDGVIITGAATGDPADCNQLKDLKRCTKLPVLVGSGVTSKNLKNYLSADGLIVGSHFKKCGRWQNEVSEEDVHSFMQHLNELQKVTQ